MTSPTATTEKLPLPLLLRIFIPFALGYFLSYLYRVVNAVIAPDLVAELGLTASDLGLLTAAYFLTFAAFQIPLGVLLDRYGPRKTEAVLLMFAAAGAYVFAISETSTGLMIGRALIGFGVSACLMAAFKAFADWFDPKRLPLVNGIQMASGGLGALGGTVPVQMALEVTDWRQIFIFLAVITFFVAIIVFFTVPQRRKERVTTKLSVQLKGTWAVFCSPAFWVITPLSVTTQSTFIAVQSLWAGPWLRDIAGFDRPEISTTLLFVAVAMISGHLLLGAATERLGRIGVKPAAVASTCLTIFVLLQIPIILEWTSIAVPILIAYGFFGSASIITYAALTQQFPQELAGRVNTSINLLAFSSIFLIQWAMGAIIDQWPQTASGGYAPEGYQAAFITFWVVELAAVIWYFLRRKKL